MKLETIIYIIIGIGFFLYRQYTEYVKRDAESRKKAAEQSGLPFNETQKPKKAPIDFEKTLEQLLGLPETIKEETKPNKQLEPIPSYGESDYPYEGRNPENVIEERVVEKYVAEKYVPMKAESMLTNNRINPNMKSNEVRSGKTIHAEHDHNFKLKKEEESSFEFDLETAVIGSIILERRF